MEMGCERRNEKKINGQRKYEEKRIKIPDYNCHLLTFHSNKGTFRVVSYL